MRAVDESLTTSPHPAPAQPTSPGPRILQALTPKSHCVGPSTHGGDLQLLGGARKVQRPAASLPAPSAPWRFSQYSTQAKERDRRRRRKGVGGPQMR
jgi:hypothetical protein